MRPNWYCDMHPIFTGRGVGMAAPVMRGHTLRMLHGFFAKETGKYAIALPPDDDAIASPKLQGALRIFASSRDDMDALVTTLSPVPWFRDYVRILYGKPVPEDFAGTWTSFTRFRIPTLKQDRHEGEAHGRLRERRMKTAHVAGLQYFIMQSGSNKQQFTMYVQMLAGVAPKEECFPNSYGLSVPTRQFCLPDMPWS